MVRLVGNWVALGGDTGGVEGDPFVGSTTADFFNPLARHIETTSLPVYPVCRERGARNQRIAQGWAQRYPWTLQWQ